MEHKYESASILTIISLLGLLLLTSCADAPLPTWMTGEPGPDVLNAPRVVGTPTSVNDPSYPNLATVPAKPKDFSSKAARQDIIGEMRSDKAQAEDIKKELDSLPSKDSESSSQQNSLGTLPKASP